MSSLTARWHRSIQEIPEQHWQALVGDQAIPFYRWSWLEALESSGSIIPEQGWQPLHLALWRKDVPIAVAPLYLKGHSYGEFVFDQTFARLAGDLGLRYYPSPHLASPKAQKRREKAERKAERARKREERARMKEAQAGLSEPPPDAQVSLPWQRQTCESEQPFRRMSRALRQSTSMGRPALFTAHPVISAPRLYSAIRVSDFHAWYPSQGDEADIGALPVIHPSGALVALDGSAFEVQL